ncbi:hypothetical protein MWH03_00560 [Klebsiella pneumoniae]|nr:hypothetical protein [Klebsiella pneumoniae]
MNNVLRRDLALAEQKLDDLEQELNELLLHVNDAIDEADNDYAQGYELPSWVNPLRNIVSRIQGRIAENEAELNKG